MEQAQQTHHYRHFCKDLWVNPPLLTSSQAQSQLLVHTISMSGHPTWPMPTEIRGRKGPALDSTWEAHLDRLSSAKSGRNIPRDLSCTHVLRVSINPPLQELNCKICLSIP